MGIAIGAAAGLGIFLVLWASAASVIEPKTISPEKIQHRRARRKAFAQGLGAGIASGLLAILVIGNLPVAGAIAVLGAFLPRVFRNSRQRKARAEGREIWPEVLDSIVSRLRAGLSVGQALAGLSTSGGGALTRHFEVFAEELQATGRLGPSLDRLKNSLGDPVADRIIESIRISARLGGHDLAKTLESLAVSMRAENRARGELLARQSWTVNGARIAAVSPWIVLALLATRPGTVEAFRSSTGTLILLGGLVASLVAYGLMLRLGRLPEEKRVFAGPETGFESAPKHIPGKEVTS
ncbi:Flp pilus assembly protein TadB [Actinobaculum suis]|uniref:Flp pilus assembly protein TadB n=1 Tax=Actinobaculum suis TaxID=1657 RepID=A0A7Z8Y8V7_9ACTO|nr:type II secretion system F family protein [Actinobaculum suis]VDG76132.1 Flp pilus assembly protein TadB [Actinobaculum suis]